MIRARDAISVARGLLGTPYGEMDCINLIKAVIRTAPGGVADYTTAGTNTLWRSYEAAPKYHDLIWRREGVSGAQAGMLAFMRDGADVHHVGICTGENTVIHASSAAGETVETPLDQSWAALAMHRYIDTAKEEDLQAPQTTGVVRTQGGRLNVRGAPGGDVIGTLPNGSGVDLLKDHGDWLEIAYAGGSGFVFSAYVERAQAREPWLRVIDEEGNVYTFFGRVSLESVE